MDIDKIIKQVARAHNTTPEEVYQQAGRFDGKADRIPGRTVGRFGGSHPHR